MLSKWRVNLKIPSQQENTAFSHHQNPLKNSKNAALKKTALTGEKKYDVLLLLLHTYVIVHKKCNKM